MKFTDFSIKKQFKLITICICLLIVLLSSTSLYFVHQALIKRNSSYIKEVSYNSQLEISHNFRQISSITNTIIIDPDLEDLLISPYSSDTIKYLNNLNRKFDFFLLRSRKLLISLFVPTRSPGQIFSIKKPPWNYEIKFLIRQHFKALDLCAIL